MLTLVTSRQFEKDYAKLKRSGYDMKKLQNVIYALRTGAELPEKCRPHKLSGTWQGYWDCHVEGDWVLIYKIDKGNLILVAQRTGTHSELFKRKKS